MSENKTVIQGLESNDYTRPNATLGESPSFYSRSAHAPVKGTVVPGMDQGGFQADSPSAAPAPAQRNVLPGKPIVGFLYSVSRTPLGEYWPLQIGRNTIGQAADSDIVLAEGTISANHAVIVTRQVKNGLIAAISDTQSTNGTMINGETIGFTAEECHNGDIITIGSNYQLLLVLIDAAKLGLAVSKDFIAVAQPEEEEDDALDVPHFDDGATRPGYYGSTGPGWSGSSAPSDGTVGLDGAGPIGHGGTVSL